MKSKNLMRNKTLDLIYIALFAAIIAVCSWISVPSTVPFTLQTLGVFCAVGLLGGKRGTLSVLVYIMLGAIGIPVFSNFTGGISVLFGKTGGYIVGFLISCLIYWGVSKIIKNKVASSVIGMGLGLIACYAFGTAWFMIIYSTTSGPIGIATALAWCVIPFIIPDIIKITVAVFIVNAVSRYIKI